MGDAPFSVISGRDGYIDREKEIRDPDRLRSLNVRKNQRLRAGLRGRGVRIHPGPLGSPQVQGADGSAPGRLGA